VDGDGRLASVLARATPLPIAVAEHAEPIEIGRIRIAPSDHHLLLGHDHVRLDRGPTENRVRPSVDTLFRSAAVMLGERAIGVVLTGHLFDGSSGASAIKRCGGVVIVQSPEDAEHSSMPTAAIATGAADHVVPLAAMGAVLSRVTGEPRLAGAQPRHDLVLEQCAFTCPVCGGSLWRSELTRRVQCALEHAFDIDVLADAHERGSVPALTIAIRTLDERVRVLADMCRARWQARDARMAGAYDARMRDLLEAAGQLRRMLGVLPQQREGRTAGA
jgi:two-component system chemotaxis response regulator CheB